MEATETPAGLRVPAGPLRPWLVPVCRGFEWIAMIMLVVATAAIMTEVVARGFFNLGLPAFGELAKYAGLGVIFLAVPLLLARDGHVKVDMFHRMTRGRIHRALAVFNELATFAFCLVFLISCWWFMQRAARFSTPALNMPNVWYYLPAIAGMVLTTLVAADRVLGILRGRETEASEARAC